MGKSIVVKIIQFFLEHFLMYSCRLQSPAWEYGGPKLRAGDREEGGKEGERGKVKDKMRSEASEQPKCPPKIQVLPGTSECNLIR